MRKYLVIFFIFLGNLSYSGNCKSVYDSIYAKTKKRDLQSVELELKKLDQSAELKNNTCLAYHNFNWGVFYSFSKKWDKAQLTV